MPIYRDHILPVLTNRIMAHRHFSAMRREITNGLHGTIVEVGFGSGLNLPHLPAAVERVIAVDPSAHGWRLARARVDGAGIPVDFHCRPAESLPIESASMDGALVTWTLCTAADPLAVLREIRRVLKPAATLHIAEHGLSPSARQARWQHRLTPIQQALGGGCRLDNDVPALLAAAGFATTTLTLQLERWSPLIACHYLGRLPPA